MEPVFVVDVRDRATGKQVAVRVSREEALLPLGELLRGALQVSPEALVAAGRLAVDQANTLFRVQDLVYPVDGRGRLGREPYRGLAWRDQFEGFALDLAEPALFERVRRAGGPDLLVLPVEADRRDVRFERNWRGFHARRFARFRAPAEQLVTQALPDGVALDGPEAERRFVEAVARRIWRADFENYSRFIGPDGDTAGNAYPPPSRLRTGDETVENMLAGRGGVCTEKVLALKLITDAHRLSSRVVFAGPRTTAPFPAAELREMLDQLESYDFTYARRYLRYWDHVALEYHLSDGSRWLVDPSGGAIPYLFAPATPYLARRPGRASVPVRMLAVEEPVTYHRAPVALGLDFLFAWETWIVDVDLMQVFDNQLGLLVSEDFYVAPVVWGSPTKRAVALASWRTYAREYGLEIGVAPGVSRGVDAPLPDAGDTDARTLNAFAARHPAQASHCRAALPGLARRYGEYILARYGIDKPFGVDLAVLGRRKDKEKGEGEE